MDKAVQDWLKAHLDGKEVRYPASYCILSEEGAARAQKDYELYSYDVPEEDRDPLVNVGEPVGLEEIPFSEDDLTGMVRDMADSLCRQNSTVMFIPTRQVKVFGISFVNGPAEPEDYYFLLNKGNWWDLWHVNYSMPATYRHVARRIFS